MINYCLVPNRHELSYDAAQAIKWGTRAGQEARTMLQIHQSGDAKKAAIAKQLLLATKVIGGLKARVTHRVTGQKEGKYTPVMVMDLKPSDYLGTRANFQTKSELLDASKIRPNSAAKIVYEALIEAGARVEIRHRINDKFRWVVRMYVVVQA